MGFMLEFDGKKSVLSEECSEYLEKVAIGMAKNATGDWRNNQFFMRISETDGVIKTSVHGLSKVHKVNEFPFSDILDSSNRKKYIFYGALYNFIQGLNEMGISPDEINFNFIPGRQRIWGDLDDSPKITYGKCKIENLKAVINE